MTAPKSLLIGQIITEMDVRNMSGGTRIKIAPPDLVEKGKKVVKGGDDMEKMLGQLNDLIERVNSSWDGLSKNEFYNRYLEQLPQLQMFPDILRSLGSSVQTAAKAFDDVDAEIAEAIG